MRNTKPAFGPGSLERINLYRERAENGVAIFDDNDPKEIGNLTLPKAEKMIHETKDPIDSMIDLLENCDDETLRKIDERIAEHRAAINSLRKLKSTLGRASTSPRAPSRRSATSGPRLIDRIAEFLEEFKETDVDTLAKELDASPKAIRMAIIKKGGPIACEKGTGRVFVFDDPEG